jgi:hypothetical protein
MFKKIIFCLGFFFASTVSCSEKVENSAVSTSECEQIKNILTDCMGLHRGAFDYVKSCGGANLEEIKNLKSCQEIMTHIEKN